MDEAAANLRAKETGIPPRIKELHPCIDEKGYERLLFIRHHPDAPRWNVELGDRLRTDDLEAVAAFRKEISGVVSTCDDGSPSAGIVEWVSSMRPRCGIFRRHIPEGLDLQRHWEDIATTDRKTIVTEAAGLLPDGADLDRLIVYDTSGTTGHALLVPHHARAVALNHVIAERALAAWGADFSPGPGTTACVNVCAQRKTFVFCNVFTVWNQAGFAKVNLSEEEWQDGRRSADRFLSDLSPLLITTDPVSLATMMEWNIELSPAAIVSTALQLDPRLARDASRRYGCPVIDWYSTTETGPIAFADPSGRGYLPAAPDLYVEVLDEDGRRVGDGEWGEITVTGGRNPYLPLLRYRTGDRARLGLSPWRLLELEGRKPVFYRRADGGKVNPVDISRELRLVCMFASHRFVQRRDLSCELTVRPLPNYPVDPGGMSLALRELFGDGVETRVTVDPTLGDDSPGGKVDPWPPPEY